MSSIDSYRHRLLGFFDCPSDYDLVGGASPRQLPIYQLDEDIAEDAECFDGKAGDLLLMASGEEDEVLRIAMPQAQRFFDGESVAFESQDDLFCGFWSANFAYKLGVGCRKLGWHPDQDLERWLAEAVLKQIADQQIPAVKEGMVAVPLSDLVDAYERIENTKNFEYSTSGMICPALGRVLLNQGPGLDEIEKMEQSLEDNPDGPDPFVDSVNFPDRQDLRLGWELCVDFATEHFPAKADEVRDYFRRKGGYRRFHDLVYRHNLQKPWHSFEDDRIRAALLKWCRANDIAVDAEK